MGKTAKPKSKKHTAVSAVILTLVLLTGIALLLYPTVADYINSLDYRKDIEKYQDDVKKLDDTTRQNMLKEAEEWNIRLAEKSELMSLLTSKEHTTYNSLLDPTGTGIIGYIEIEKLKIYLPIYHGTEESVLQSGIGHLEGSSLPIGGKGTHALLSGHSGLPSSKLFSNIDQLKKGDTFVIHVLGEVLTYRVESSAVMLPEDAEKQEFYPDRDICTLMTCTPYGVNTHRLLVQGVRVENVAEEKPEMPVEEEIPEEEMPVILWAAIFGIPAVIIAAVIILLVRHKKRRK